MLVTALGHAGIRLTTSAGASVLCDPWFSPEGCFQGSWFPFPDNSHLLGDERLLRPDAILVSHEHLDHVDPWFLARVPADVPVYIPRYPSPLLRQKVLAGGDRPIIVVDAWEEFEPAPGVTAFFVSEPPMHHDSAIVLQADGRSVLNLNDAHLFPMHLRDIRRSLGGQVDVLCFQGSGASWYPMVYDYDDERKAQLARQKRLGKLAYCQKVMKLVEPVVGIPLAGPPAFLDPELFPFNAQQENDGIFPDPQQVAEWLARRGAGRVEVLLPGDAWDAEGRAKVDDPEWSDFSFDQRWDYLRDYARRRAPHVQAALAQFPEPEGSVEPEMRRWLGALLASSPHFRERIGMRVGFEIRGPGGGEWSVDFRAGREGVYAGVAECGYVYTFDSRWVPALASGALPWVDFVLSNRFRARRNPDRYSDHLHMVLKYCGQPEALAAVEAFETTFARDERMAVHLDGKVYSISRYCPHAGGDLLQAGEILPDGRVRCLAHAYEFDIRTGECLTGTCAPLAVQVAEAAA